MADLRIALAQIDTCVGDLEGNAQAVLTWARRAADAGADLVAFPEMCLTGYPVEDLALRASFRRGAERALTATATRLAAEGLGHLTVVVGTVGERTTREHDGAPRAPPTRPSSCGTASCRPGTTSTTCPTTACSTSSGSSPRGPSRASSRSGAAGSGW
ncbi:nitrilase-related carbon-nitrogen hydrolase [Cellulomonas sp. ATA003]|nr:nitrilase-related carbon-nitrogen hydrolase [Cellulomonas sp. ATA003]WNB84496.1 nitrilase-related carbon-nitrogen hydrolase [Cellulomonas sp. ATA003]